MVKRRTERFQCGTKKKIETRRKARMHLGNVRDNDRKSSARYMIYLCPHCGFYHVGKRPIK